MYRLVCKCQTRKKSLIFSWIEQLNNIINVNYNLQNKQIFDVNKFYINIGLNGDLILVIKDL